MCGYGKHYILVICLSQLLVSNSHSIFNLRNRIINFFYGNPPDFFYLHTREKFAPHYHVSKFGTKYLE